MNENQFNEITKWQAETFPNATPLSKIAHLEEEIKELTIDLQNHIDNRHLEYADCFFLLFGAAAADGMSYQDICKAIDEKFVINKNRQWGKPDASGVVNHIKPTPQPVACKKCYHERIGELSCPKCGSAEYEIILIA